MYSKPTCAKSRSLLIGVIVLALIAAAFCAASLTPTKAYAAGGKTMWVVTSVKAKSLMDGDDTVSLDKYSYRNGLVVRTTRTITNAGYKDTYITSYKYGKKYRIVGEKETTNGKAFSSIVYQLDKKGHVVKRISTPKGSTTKYTSTYKYDTKGRLKKSVGTFGNSTYFYNSKGLVTTLKEDSAETGKTSFKYKYDASNQVTLVKESGYVQGKYENTYKGTRLVKAVRYSPEGDKEYVTTYTYKKVSVPKAAVKTVKAQQAAIFSPCSAPLETTNK